MSVNHLYIAAGSFEPVEVTPREGTVLPADPADHRPFTFEPVNAAGQGVEILKYTVTDDTLAAYLAADSADARTVILTGSKNRAQTSAIRPTNAQLTRAASLACWGPEFWAQGIFALVSDAAESSAKTKSLSKDEKRAAARTALLARFPVAVAADPAATEPAPADSPADSATEPVAVTPTAKRGR